MDSLPSSATDAEIAENIRATSIDATTVFAVIVDAYHGAVMLKDSHGPGWRCLAIGDVSECSLSVLRELAKVKRARWHQVEHLKDVAALEDVAEHASALSVREFRQWEKHKAAVTGLTTNGRRGDITSAVREEVIALAAWHCQMCGESLRQHLAGGARGNYSYLAHIVAASKDGPRGDHDLPIDQINAAENLILLCDKCHRLIDRVDPDTYSREVLVELRRRSIVDVDRLLSTLRFPPAEMLVIGGNISGQVAAFDKRVAEQAMWNQRLRPAGSIDWFGHSGHLGDATKPHYWHSAFELLETEIPKVRTLLHGAARGGTVAPKLAVFPLHNMSMLVLAGRLVGEARSVHTFQFHRDAVSGQAGGQWNWPETIEPPADKYRYQVLQRQNNATEAVLLVHLTARIPIAEMPSTFQADGDWRMSVVEVTVDEPNHGIIGHPRDLELLGRTIDQALRLLQDDWRVEQVHCVVIAPVSACFRIGQKLQAKFHRRIRLYEREQYQGSASYGQFVPTIDIHAGVVALPGSGESIRIS